MLNKKYFTTKELSQYLGRSEKAIRNLCFRREIPHFKPAGRLLFDIEEINSWIQSHEVVSLEEITSPDEYGK
jgi:excisionase family DNA binding protein